MCTTITIDEKSIDIVLDALRALKNEMLDNMNFSDKSHGEVENVETLFENAKKTIDNMFVVAIEKDS